MTKALVWGTALIILLGAAVLAGGASQPSSVTKPAIGPRDPELSRCQGLGEAGGQDARCRAAWASARTRFFGGAAS
ncbi:putative entry exclusion protein TrbK-alt [Caulobacter sp.]|uniref:putative entry exclusion protein TrbK-alt n=1 Tax=Caulobacter sp. TaxID=78 RepID=UPI0031CE3068